MNTVSEEESMTTYRLSSVRITAANKFIMLIRSGNLTIDRATQLAFFWVSFLLSCSKKCPETPTTLTAGGILDISHALAHRIRFGRGARFAVQPVISCEQ
jgi:hypothetical protein